MDTKAEHRFHYFVAYVFNTAHASGSGRIDIRTRLPITGISDIERIEKVIREQNPDFTDVVVFGWQRFETGG